MGLFSKIIDKKAKNVSFDFLKTDIHSHLLPGIDDGAQNVEDSIAMIRGFKELGYKKMITTPHIMSDRYPNTPDTIKKAYDTLQEELQKQHIEIEIEYAAEHYMDDYFFQLIKEKTLLTFGDKYVLFEFPHFIEPMNFKEAIFEMQLAGYKPVLAHPERYNYWHRNFEQLESFHEQGVLLQANLLSFIGFYDNEVKKTAEKLLDKNIISFFGSDCHRIEQLHLLNSNLSQANFDKIKATAALNNTL